MGFRSGTARGRGRKIPGWNRSHDGRRPRPKDLSDDPYDHSSGKHDSRKKNFEQPSASLLGISMSARRDAKQIVRAVEYGRSEQNLAASANLLARFHNLFPETSLAVLDLVNRLLPAGNERVKFGKGTAILERPWMRAITYWGTPRCEGTSAVLSDRKPPLRASEVERRSIAAGNGDSVSTVAADGTSWSQ